MLSRSALAAALVLGSTLGLSVQRAQAVTFDFGVLAEDPTAGVGEGFWNSQITTTGHTYSVGLLGVVATASGTRKSKAYLDGPDGMGGKTAGLGVCSTRGGCAGTNDDNVGRAGDKDGGKLETLTLTFTQNIKLTDLDFKNENHDLFNGKLKINGTIFSVVGGELTTAELALLAATPTSVFNFTALKDSEWGKEDDKWDDDGRLHKDFYVNLLSGDGCGPVGTGCDPSLSTPLPASLPLFISGLGALGFFGWRRKSANKRKTAA